MKIACLVRYRPHTVFFVNRIHRQFGVDLLLIETPSDDKKLSNLLKQKGVIGTIKTARKKFFPDSSTNHMYDSVFGNDWKEPDEGIPALQVENINSEEAHTRLAELKADVLLDHGTSILKNKILATAPLALNLHWGLSPYYRGTFCTEWALLNNDPLNIGVTVHKLARQIDGGDIAAQKRCELNPNDTVESINARLSKEGTLLAIRLLEKLEKGQEPDFHSQDLSTGELILKKDFTSAHSKKVSNLKIEEIIANPSRRAQPIIEL